MKALGKNAWKKNVLIFCLSLLYFCLSFLSHSLVSFALICFYCLFCSCCICRVFPCFFFSIPCHFCLPSEKLSSVDRELLGQLGMITALTADQYWYLFWNDDCCALWSRRISDPISDYQSQDGCSVHNRYQQLIVQSLKWRSTRSSSQKMTKYRVKRN